jgi:dTDP-4-dehydrorhamnose reductase
MGCYLICKKNAKGVFNISGPDLLNPFQMATLTAEYFNLNKDLIEEFDGTIFTQVAKRPPKTGFILDKARKQLGYNPHTFMQGIEILARQIENS